MELDDLLKKEGLDAAGIDDALAWARRRAAELVRDVDGDPELGPLLGGAKVVADGELTMPPATTPTAAAPSGAAPTPARPLFSDLRGLQAAFLAEGDEDEDADLPEVGAVLRAFQKARSGPSRAATSDASKAPASAASEPARDAAASLEAPPAPVHEAAPIEAEPAEATPVPVVGDASTADASQASAAVSEDLTPAPTPAADVAIDGPTPTDPAGEGAAAHGVPAPPEVDLDPLAGIDFDDLPGVDEDDDEDDHTHVDLPAPGRAAADQELEGRVTMVPVDGPDMTLPSMQVPLAEVTLTMGRIDAVLGSGELTERVPNPLLPAEPSGEVTVTAMAPNPLRAASPETLVGRDVTAPATVEPAPDTASAPAEAEAEAEEIELLDDEDLLLVEEDVQEEEEEVPEWKQALASAQLEREKAAGKAATPPVDSDDEGDVDMGDDE